MNDTEPVRATPADDDRVLATLTAAFIRDPLMRWMFPDARAYLRWFPDFTRHFGGAAFGHASAWRSQDYHAAALWLPPGTAPDTQALGALVTTAVAPGTREDVFELMRQVAAAHPAQDHWHLPVIGVDPLRQGRGYAGRLLAAGLAACDDEGVPAWLEATNPANVPLYRRFGFQPVRTLQVGSSPTVTCMLRPAPARST